MNNNIIYHEIKEKVATDFVRLNIPVYFKTEEDIFECKTKEDIENYSKISGIFVCNQKDLDKITQNIFKLPTDMETEDLEY